MGGAASSADDEDLQDFVYPWFHLIQWCAEEADQGVFKWDLPGIQAAVKGLTVDVETFLAKCPKELEASSSCPSVSVGEDTKLAYMEWAEALLEWNPELKKVRFKLVPSRMREVTFWSRYFAGVRTVVQKLVFPDEADEDSPAAARAAAVKAANAALETSTPSKTSPQVVAIHTPVETPEKAEPENPCPFRDDEEEKASPKPALSSQLASAPTNGATAAGISQHAEDEEENPFS